MAGMGPVPKHADTRARRNKTLATTKLPAEGRQGKTPRWPLIPDVVTKAKRDVAAAKVDELRYQLQEMEEAGHPTGSLEYRLETYLEKLFIQEARLKEQRRLEALVWRELWKIPAAVQWERTGWTRDIAQYVRLKVLAELGDLDAAKESRQWSDRLGLNPLALMRLRWEVAVDEVGEQRSQRQPASRSRYAGLQVVDAGKGAADAAGA